MPSFSQSWHRLYCYRRSTLLALLTIFLLCSWEGKALASFKLDATFGSGGKATAAEGNGGPGNAMLLQPDGKIIVVGFTHEGSTSPNQRIGLARFNSDGTLDATFGTGGIVITNVSNTYGKAAVLQPDGKIVVLGKNSASTVLARYNPNGTIDTRFGTNGIVISTFFEEGYDVALQPDGKLLATGTGPSTTGFYVARYDSDGTVDTGFGTSGRAFIPLPGGNYFSEALALQPDGRILVSGIVFFTNGKEQLRRGVIVRIESNGTQDLSFGPSGRVTGLFGDTVYDLKRQPDGKIVIATNIAAYRVTSSGQVDGSLIGYNLPASNLNQSASISFTSIGFLPNGKTVLGGSFHPNDPSTGTGSDFLLLTLSPSFTFESFITTDFFGDTDRATDLVLQPEGKIVVAGYAYGPGQVFALARYITSVAPNGDFDGDRRTDFSIFRTGNGVWHTLLTSPPNSYQVNQWGLGTDKPVPGDYDGDGKTDLAVFRSGVWHILRSSDGAYRALQWGLSTDTPIAADYDGDGKTDVAVLRSGDWHIIRSSDGHYAVPHWGLSTDRPVPADYDGDGKVDLAVIRDGVWHILQSSNNVHRYQQWGFDTDLPTPADYDGDGRADIAIFRPSNGQWSILRSLTNTVSITNWGLNGDVPSVGDYDGDGKSDIAIFRPSTGYWSVLKSTTQTPLIVKWGQQGDVPVPAAYYH